jgi:NAD(P)-dependent dehydrogenase (short-subunit alcohol dehydrogenase family)
LAFSPLDYQAPSSYRQEDVMKIEGIAALVTGASRGLGEALARALAARGARLALVAREAGPLERVVEEIRVAGGEAHALAADVADKEAVYALAGTAARLVGPIDLLVHNASTLGPVPLAALGDTDCEDVSRALEVNLLGPFRLTKAIVGGMILRRRGLVLLVSSDAAQVPYANWGAYSASKAALEQLGRVWAAELDGTGVAVSIVDPGEMDTRMHADALPDADRALLADPRRVAVKLVELIEEGMQSGARVSVSP